MKMDKYLLTLLFGVLMLGGCSARVVTVSPGPLIRVQGQPVSIRCDVKEYTGPREQDFDWMMQREGGPVIQVISTFDTRFSHSSLSSRVAAGDISVARLGDNVVDLRIEEVRPSDSGVYTCKTPSTDSVISGNYDATVQLTVIPDTLKVSPQPATPVVPEGSDITLSCNVTRQLTHPTYLSVTWALRKGASQLEEFLTFGPQGGVATATKYAQRYTDGGVRLVPGENGVFGLVVSRATVADEGMYVCIGREWTHEDGGTWKNIVEKRGEMGTVTVTPTGQSLSVTASSPSSSSSSSSLLSPGDTLNLLCSVAATNLPSLALEVTWSADGNDIISVDRSGVVVSNMSAQGGRGVGGGEVGLERTGTGEFRLLVRGVGGEDGGVYTCRVRAFIEKGGRKGGAGRWYMAAEKTSNPVTVKVSEIKPSFSLTLDPVRNPQMTAEPTELACHVTNITHLPLGGRLGVAWEHTTLPGIGDDPQTSHPIGSLDGHGNLLTGAMYSDRLDSGVMSLTRVQPNTFKLRFLQTQEVDMGEYVCTVSAWSVNRQGDMVKTVEYQSSPLTVRWEPKRPSLSVVAKRIREASVGGATFEMSCAVASENLGEAGYSVLIQSQESLEGTVRTIMTLSPDNVLQHGGATDPSRRDSLVLTKSGPAEFRFRLAGVQLSDRGYYWCDITAWTKQQPRQTWTRATSAESNKVRIDFEENGPSFSIAIQSDSSSVYPWETAKMECSLSVSGSSPKTDDLAYEVRWFFTRLRGGDTVTQVASIDRFGVVRKDARNSSSDISVERRDTHTYLLNVHGTQDSDSGEYHCTATPWYLSASTGAWTQAGELTSARVFLTVRFAVWDSLKLPLLYGASASLGVGLFSLVLGLVCAQCCCRNTTHTPRSRNKLMDLEMD